MESTRARKVLASYFKTYKIKAKILYNIYFKYMKYIALLLLLHSQMVFAKSRECTWQKKWEIILPEKNIFCKNVDTRTFLLYWGAEKATMKNCKVISGTWYCLYSKKFYHLKTEKEISKTLQIDHIMPWHELKNRGILNKKNACEAYNDIENLIVVSAKENRAKSDFTLKPMFLRTNDPKHSLHYYINNSADKQNAWHNQRKHILKDLQNASCEMCKKYKLNNCEDFCE